jgi:glycerol kinase
MLSATSTVVHEALGITNQRETVVAWDRSSGQAVYPAIVWQDRRTADRCSELKAAGEEDWVRERTGLPRDPYFSATELAWPFGLVPGLREKVKRGDVLVGTVDSWLQ